MQVDELEIFPPENDPVVIKQMEREKKAKAKEIREKKLAKLKVVQHNVPFDANPKAQVNMTSVVALLNWNFNKALGTTFETMSKNEELDDVSQAMFAGLATVVNGIYKGVYKDNIIPWRNADNTISNVQGESLAEALEKTMLELAKTIGVKK